MVHGDAIPYETTTFAHLRCVDAFFFSTAGTLLRDLHGSLRHVCFHSQLQRILDPERHQQRGS